MTDLRKAADPYIRPGTVVPVDIETTKILVDLLRQALAQPPCQTGSQCIGGKCPECEREWVGLTLEEVLDLIPSSEWKADETLLFAREIEEILKDKNA
jgi:hypothetical protein